MRKAAAVAVVLASLLAGCTEPKGADPTQPQKIDAAAEPRYEEVARRYNANATGLDQLFAPVTVRILYYDKEGKKHEEQGEGRLQIVQPDHVAMSIGKIGETFFWLGCDSQRYWWFDLSGKPRAMYVGAHENYERSQARRIGVVVAPLDLVRLLGIVPLPATGQAQGSADGRLVGLTTELELGARQRTWVDPATGLPQKIELYNARGECELVAALSDPDTVATRGAIGPRMNRRITIAHAASSSQITLDLSDMQDGAGRIVPEAFDAKTLSRQLRADKIYDLDAPLKSPAPKPDAAR